MDTGAVRSSTGKDGEHFTYCRFCEASCGLSVTVDQEAVSGSSFLDGVPVTIAPVG